MSGEMALWAVRQDIKDPIAKLVLVALCEHCNEVGECYPNHSTLSDFVRRSKPYIRAKIRLLEEEGWIKRTARFSDGRRQTSNLYTVIEDRGETRKDYHARKAREAEEKAIKCVKSKSRGDCGQSPISRGDAPQAVPPDCPQSPVRRDARQSPLKDQKGNYALTREVEIISPERWLHRLAQWRERGMWPASWGGAPPGKAGCIVPNEVLKAWNERKADDRANPIRSRAARYRAQNAATGLRARHHG